MENLETLCAAINQYRTSPLEITFSGDDQPQLLIPLYNDNDDSPIVIVYFQLEKMFVIWDGDNMSLETQVAEIMETLLIYGGFEF